MEWQLPHFSLKPESIGQLGVLGSTILAWASDCVTLKSKFLRPYCVCYLEHFVSKFAASRFIKFEESSVNQYLAQSGFSHLSGDAELSTPFNQSMIIQLQRFAGDSTTVSRQVVSWVKQELFPFIPAIKGALKKHVTENLWEIVNNALTHGRCPHGVTTCGQFYPNCGYFEIAFYDAGLGIPNTVRTFAGKDWSDDQCIAWATQEGHSTSPLAESAGLGLHLLRQFLTVNGGIFQIASENGYYGEHHGRVNRALLRNKIEGTLVNLRIIFDERLYSLEVSDEEH